MRVEFKLIFQKKLIFSKSCIYKTEKKSTSIPKQGYLWFREVSENRII